MKKIIYTTLSLSPVMALAQQFDSGGYFSDAVNYVGGVINMLIPIMIGLAIVYFFWGLITYIRAAGDAKKASEGKSIMIWGVIAIAVMVSIWGLVVWLQGVFGINGNTIVPPVTVPGL